MHIAEGVLSAPVLIGGAGLAAAGVAYGLKKMDYERVPQVAVVSCAFFVASLVHLPVGPVSAHLVLAGLTGVLLGWAAFPAIMAALFLQAVLFQFGGLTTLGVNTVNMALPAVVCFILFNRPIRSRRPLVASISAFACGVLAVLLSGVMVALSLVASKRAFLETGQVVLVSHLPLMLVEGIVTALIIGFLKKVKPEVLEAPYASFRFGKL